ncbi:unnamed protein product [Sphagnum balticum]
MAPASRRRTNQKANSDLLEAVKAGDESKVVAALAQPGVDVNCRDDEGYYRCTPLLLACNPGDRILNTSVVRLLLQDKRVNVDARDIQGQTALHLWPAENPLEEILLSKRTDIDWNATDMIGQTPLLWFARNGFEESVRRLIGVESVNLFATTIDLFTALHQVAERKSPFPDWLTPGDISNRCNIVDLVLEASIDANVRATVIASDPDNLKPFRTNPDHLDICRPNLLSKRPREQSSRDLTPLHFAAIDGRTKVVNLLLEREAISIDAEDSASLTPLHYSVQHGHSEVVELLLKKGKPFATLDYDRQCGVFEKLLHLATKREEKTIAKTIAIQLLNTLGSRMNAFADISTKFSGNQSFSDQSKLLASAAVSNHFEIIKYIVKWQPEVNVNEMSECAAIPDLVATPLHFAAVEGDVATVGGRKRGHVEAVQELLEHPKLDVNAPDNKKKTPLLSPTCIGNGS